MATEDLQDESFIQDEQLQDDPISESDESLDPRQAEFLKQYRVVSRIALCALASSIVGLLSLLDFQLHPSVVLCSSNSLPIPSFQDSLIGYAAIL